jgi:hypothetical protein
MFRAEEVIWFDAEFLFREVGCPGLVTVSSSVAGADGRPCIGAIMSLSGVALSRSDVLGKFCCMG